MIESPARCSLHLPYVVVYFMHLVVYLMHVVVYLLHVNVYPIGVVVYGRCRSSSLSSPPVCSHIFHACRRISHACERISYGGGRIWQMSIVLALFALFAIFEHMLRLPFQV